MAKANLVGNEIAIVGADGRFPNAEHIDQFWRYIESGKVQLRSYSDVELNKMRVPVKTITNPAFVRIGVRLPGLADFAADFFGFTPAEAEKLDPHQRVFLEVAWHALESAGEAGLSSRKRTGVFAGASFSMYAMALFADRARDLGFEAFSDEEIRRGSFPDFFPTRVAHRLGLEGPAVAIQTACSSSAVAVHQAINALLVGDCDIAIAGGASGALPEVGYIPTKGGALSEDGYCRPFASLASGTASGAAVGVVVMKRLSDALKDGNSILSVVHGSAVGNDGADRAGFTAPNPDGVSRTVRQALDVATARPADIFYVEAHGSGTRLGDDVELAGIRAALVHEGDGSPVVVGSAKGLIGHAGAAAGIVGVLKGARVANRGQVPTDPFAMSLWKDSSATSNTVQRVRDTGMNVKRFVLVHSMGIGGTNAALVIGPPPPVAFTQGTQSTVLVISARTRLELDDLSRQLADHLQDSGDDLGDVSRTLRLGRTAFPIRRVVMGDRDDLIRALRRPSPHNSLTVRTETPRKVRFPVVDDSPRVRRLLTQFLESAQAGSETETDSDDIEVSICQTGTNLDLTMSSAHTIKAFALGNPPSNNEVDDNHLLHRSLAVAWANGATIDWGKLQLGGRTFVKLPPYPFTRQRYWALDRVNQWEDPGEEPRSAPQLVAYGRRPTNLPPPRMAQTEIQQAILEQWQLLFGIAEIGVDDTVESLGGTSLAVTRLASVLSAKFDMDLTLHEVGGTATTVQRLANVFDSSDGSASVREVTDRAEAEDDALESDIRTGIGPVPHRRTSAGAHTDPLVLLTGVTGFVGSHIIRELLKRPGLRIRCVVRRAGLVSGKKRLDQSQLFYQLPGVDWDLVDVIEGDIRDDELDLDNAMAGVTHVMHSAAEVVFTQPYSLLRTTNVEAWARLLRAAVGQGVSKVGLISSLAAVGTTQSDRMVAETLRESRPADRGGYASSKWMAEKLTEEVASRGLAVDIFRPGLILGSQETGACNPNDLVWKIMAASIATGLRPTDDSFAPAAPVDIVARAAVDFLLQDVQGTRVFHLADPPGINFGSLLKDLAPRGFPTSPLSWTEWITMTRMRAANEKNDILSSASLVHDDPEILPQVVIASNWRRWLSENSLNPRTGPEDIERSLRFLSSQPSYADLIGSQISGVGFP